MRNADRRELQKRMTKNNCTFTRMCGCYVDADKNIITTLNETFLNLDDAEYFKYLDIAKAVLKGKIGNNLLNLSFNGAAGQQSLAGLRSSRLKNNGMLEEIYRAIIANYDYVGNYLILFFHDAYDVITYTRNHEKLDESEDVYEYLLCAICPVNLTEPGLEYNDNKNTILPRERDWVVGMPETGFLWPAFTDRQEDRETVVFFTKDAKHPHHELCERFLEAKEFMTATERQEELKRDINEIFEGRTELYGGIHARLAELAAYPSFVDGVEKHVVIDEGELEQILKELGADENQCRKMKTNYTAICRLTGYPTSIELLDERAARAAEEVNVLQWQKNRIEILEETLKNVYEQLNNPEMRIEKVCADIEKRINVGGKQ